jgi:hypothetical protein
VLTFPFPLRFLFANDPHGLSEVLAVVQRAISSFVIRHSGLTVSSGARTSAVTLVQRFGSALNLNPHLHMLFLDGAFTFSSHRPAFQRARRPDHEQLHQLLDTLSRRIVRLLERGRHRFGRAFAGFQAAVAFATVHRPRRHRVPVVHAAGHPDLAHGGRRRAPESHRLQGCGYQHQQWLQPRFAGPDPDAGGALHHLVVFSGFVRTRALSQFSS